MTLRNKPTTVRGKECLCWILDRMTYSINLITSVYSMVLCGWTDGLDISMEKSQLLLLVTYYDRGRAFGAIPPSIPDTKQGVHFIYIYILDDPIILHCGTVWLHG